MIRRRTTGLPNLGRRKQYSLLQRRLEMHHTAFPSEIDGEFCLAHASCYQGNRGNEPPSSAFVSVNCPPFLWSIISCCCTLSRLIA